MKKTFAYSAAIIAALATGALAQRQNANEPQENPQQEQQEFVKEAASGNQMEIQEGQLAEQRAQDPQVKQLAQRLVEDHQKAQQQLQQVAQQLGVTISEQLMPVHQAMLQSIQRKQGRDFERCFSFGQVADHTKDILEYQYAAEHAQNQQLKQYAQQQIPTLREHLHMARQAAEVFVPEARTAGERIRGERGQEGTSGATSDNESDNANRTGNRSTIRGNEQPSGGAGGTNR